MSRSAILTTGIVLALGAAAIWLGGRHRDQATADTGPGIPNEAAYDYEAQDVVVRQMGPDGQLRYQMDARRVMQIADDGQISASELTITHDPPGAAPGGPGRWTLTADAARLPPQGGLITLQGKVRARGRTGSRRTPVTLATERLRYDLDAQRLSSDADVAVTAGSASGRAKGFQFDIKTSVLTLESTFDGTLTP